MSYDFFLWKAKYAGKSFVAALVDSLEIFVKYRGRYGIKECFQKIDIILKGFFYLLASYNLLDKSFVCFYEFESPFFNKFLQFFLILTQFFFNMK